MQTILVVNSKGGCGKSTIATNLAAFYAAGGLAAALLDYDPQGSSRQWVALRPRDRPAVLVMDASSTHGGATRTWQTAAPPGTERLIMDAPAGVPRHHLQEMLRRTDVILIPVAPSSIDIHATSDFIADLLLRSKIRRLGIPIGVVANRVRRASPHYEPLKRFLNSLRIPFIASLSDSEHYVTAAEMGLGIHELDEDETRFERGQWLPLINWLTDPSRVPQVPDAKAALHVLSTVRA